MPTVLYPMRLSKAEKAEFEAAARRDQVSLAEFLRRAGRLAVRMKPGKPASLEVSREGFTLPDLPGRTERERIRAAVQKRHVSC